MDSLTLGFQIACFLSEQQGGIELWFRPIDQTKCENLTDIVHYITTFPKTYSPQVCEHKRYFAMQGQLRWELFQISVHNALPATRGAPVTAEYLLKKESY